LCQNGGLSVLSSQDKFFVNNPLDVKETGEHSLGFDLHFSLGGWLLCLGIITLNQALITNDNPGQEGCIVRGDLMKLLADIDMLLLLISCQKSHQAGYATPNKRA
jgi:hypothetical protein